MSDFDPIVLGAQIRRIRRERGLKQNDLAGSHVTPGYISLIELGKRLPSRKALQHIAKVLGVDERELTSPMSMDDLLHDQDHLALTACESFLMQGDIAQAKEHLEKLSAPASLSLPGRCANLEISSIDIPSPELVDRAALLMHEASQQRSWDVTRRALLVFVHMSEQLGLVAPVAIQLSALHNTLESLECGDAQLLAHLYGTRSRLWLTLGDLRAANIDAKRANDYAHILRDPMLQVQQLWNQVRSDWKESRYQEALTSMNAAREVLMFLDSQDIVTRTNLILADVLYRTSGSEVAEVRTCLEEIERAIAYAHARNTDTFVTSLQVARMNMLLLLGNFEDALTAISDDIDQAFCTSLQKAEVEMCRARVALASHRVDDAIGYFDQASEALLNEALLPNAKWHLQALAEAFRDLGNAAKAYDLLSCLVAIGPEDISRENALHLQKSGTRYSR